MNLDSGELTVKQPTYTQTSGLMPTQSYSNLLTCCYAERSVGYSRYFTALQNDMRVDYLVRIPQYFGITTDCRVTLNPYSHTDGNTYKILEVQQIVDDDGISYTDLSLERMVEAYAG